MTHDTDVPWYLPGEPRPTGGAAHALYRQLNAAAPAQATPAPAPRTTQLPRPPSGSDHELRALLRGAGLPDHPLGRLQLKEQLTHLNVGTELRGVRQGDIVIGQLDGTGPLRVSCKNGTLRRLTPALQFTDPTLGGATRAGRTWIPDPETP